MREESIKMKESHKDEIQLLQDKIIILTDGIDKTVDLSSHTARCSDHTVNLLVNIKHIARLGERPFRRISSSRRRCLSADAIARRPSQTRTRPGYLCDAADRALGRGPGAAYSNLKTSSSPTHDCVGWSRNLVVFCLPAQKDRMSVVSVALVDFKT